MIERYILDSWAVMAFFQNEEPAADRVEQLFRGAQTPQMRLFMSIINLGEVYYQIGRRRGQVEAEKRITRIRALPIVLLPVSDEYVFAAARFKMNYKMSYADAFAAAAAEQEGAILVTGDAELWQLEGVIQVEKLHRRER